MPSTIIYTSTDAPRSSLGRDSHQAVRKSSVVNSPQDGLLSVLYHPPFLISIHLPQPMFTDTYPARVRVAPGDYQDTKMLHAHRRSLQPSLKPALKQDINAIHKLSSHPQTNDLEYSEYGTVLYSTRPSRPRTTLAWPPQPLHSTLSQSRAQHPREGVPGDITHTLSLRNERDPVIVRTRLANRSYFNASPGTSGRDTTPRTPRTSTPYASSVDVYLLPKSTSSTITTSSGLRDDDDEIVGWDGAERKCDVAPIGFPKPTSPCRVASPLCETAMNTISQRLEPEPPRTVGDSLDHKPATLTHNGITFTITGRIADGGTGRVVAGEHRGKRYAIKVVHKWHAFKAFWHTRATFVRERDAMVRVSTQGNSPYLVPLLMAWEDAELLHFVMPSHPLNLHSMLEHGSTVALKDRLLLCVELIAALQALWRLNIVHQDIKPHNILIDHDGRAVLSDFGLAALVPPGEYNTWREYSEAGTPAYMAPEILLRDHATSGHGAAVDVWSLGIVFLEILGLTDKWYFLVPSCEMARKLHAQCLPIKLDLPAAFGAIPAVLLPMMLKEKSSERIAASELHKYVPQHDWRPGNTDSLDTVPAGRCLEFATFKANEKRFERFKTPTEADAAQLRAFEKEQAEVKLTDFEFLAPGMLGLPFTKG